MIQEGSLSQRMGFKTTKFGGYHASFTIRAELALLFQAVLLESPAECYTEAILRGSHHGERLGLTLSALRWRRRSGSASAKPIAQPEADLETWLVEVKGLVAEKLSDGQVST